ncbi:MAG: transposase [Ruminococcus sp.]|nr:transposase [Ruminococcus sp.]
MNTRKQIRLQNYDYSENGAYFITICTKDKKQIFGRVVGDGILDVPQDNVVEKENVYIRLSEVGKIVKQAIEYINEHNKNVDVKKYVIMPNHIHLIVMVNVANGTSRKPSPTLNNITTRQNEIIPKLISSLKRFTNKQCGFDIWQRSYIDHVIRNEQDYLKHLEYIDNNPIRKR